MQDTVGTVLTLLHRIQDAGYGGDSSHFTALSSIYMIKSGMNNYVTMPFLLITLIEHVYIKKPSPIM
jgi:hypothetical protein